MNNAKVRNAAKQCGVKHWQIAEQLGVSEQTIMRWLRMPLPAEKEKAILGAIHDLAAQKMEVV